MFKKFGMVLLGVTLLLGIAACTDAVETEAAGVYVSVDINPSIEFILDEDDNVVSYSLTNEDAEIICSEVDFVGMNIDDAVELFVELATEAGFIDVDGEDNAVLITVLGDDDDDELVEGVKTRIRTRVMRFMATHYINGEVLIEDFTQADLLAQAKELGVSPGKLKLALLAQAIEATLPENATPSAITVDEIPLEVYLEMSVKDLLAIVKVQHQADMAELTEDKLALRQAKKAALMAQFKIKLTEHISNNPQLTEEQIEARVEAINSKATTQTKTSWDERVDEWKKGVDQRQNPENQSKDNGPEDNGPDDSGSEDSGSSNGNSDK